MFLEPAPAGASREWRDWPAPDEFRDLPLPIHQARQCRHSGTRQTPRVVDWCGDIAHSLHRLRAQCLISPDWSGMVWVDVAVSADPTAGWLPTARINSPPLVRDCGNFTIHGVKQQDKESNNSSRALMCATALGFLQTNVAILFLVQAETQKFPNYWVSFRMHFWLWCHPTQGQKGAVNFSSK